MKKEYRELQTSCIHCGKTLVHRWTGRRKKFCDGWCRTWHMRAVRRWEKGGKVGQRPGNPPHTARFVQVADSETLTRGGDGDENE